MCEPTTITMAALAITSAAATMYSQQQQANYQDDVNNRQAQNIETARRASLANIDVQKQQNLADAREQINKNTMAGRAASATAATAAGEAGVSGTSVDALIRELQGKAAWDNVSTETNYLRQDTALNAQRQNVNINSNSQLNSLTTPASPDYLGTAVKLGQTGLNIYSGYKKDQASSGLSRVQTS